LDITVEVMGHYKSIVGSSIVKVSIQKGASVMDLIDTLAKKYGDEFTSEIYKPLTAPDAESSHAATPNVFVNDRGISAEALYKTVIKPGDKVTIASPPCQAQIMRKINH